MLYQLCTVFHLLFVISWMCGLFYLPRFFVYHVEALRAEAQDTCRWFIRMERNLFRFTMVMLVLGVFFGSVLSYQGHWYQASWLWVKLLCVCGMMIYQYICYRTMCALARGEMKHSPVYYRIFNELPVFLLLVTLIMVVMKPAF